MRRGGPRGARSSRAASRPRPERSAGPRRARDALLVVEALDEARELDRGAADSAQRLVVVHAHRAEQRDRAERPVREPVGGADEGHVVQSGMVELVADADERAPRLERLADQLQQRRALLERLEQPLARLELVPARLAEEAGGAA